MSKQNIERRSFAIELRQNEGQPTVLTGYAAVFDQLSEDLGGFKEKLVRGCFARSLKENPDIVAFFDHEELLGRTSAGTLKLREDDHGLAFELSIPDTSCGRDLVEMVKRGDIQGCSFGFVVRSATWLQQQGELPIRAVEDLELIEVSTGVVFPAYTGTQVALRSLKEQTEKTDSKQWLSDARKKLLKHISTQIK